MQVNISDKDLEELILKGKNNKYKMYSKDKRFLEGLARVYKIMHIVATAEDLGHYSYLHYKKLANNVYLSLIRVVNGRVELKGYCSKRLTRVLKSQLLN